MRIACLGWGSLIWDPRGLHIAGPWNQEGPLLPIELARQSSGDRLTLVLVPEWPLVQVLWVGMTDHVLDAARANLAERERSAAIGVWPTDAQNRFTAVIGRWAEEKGLDAVVWTALGPNFDGVRGRVPTESEVLHYLRRLVAAGKANNAEEYIRNAPAQVRTAYRETIERELHWTPRPVRKRYDDG